MGYGPGPLSSTMASASSATSATRRSRALPPGTIVESEVFENERLQPFVGWGSSWPGHLLPTDRCGRYSARDGSPGGDAAAEFRRVARPLPRGGGWRWIEPDWRLDLSHIDVGSVDEEGWTYSFDFTTCEWPPPPVREREKVFFFFFFLFFFSFPRACFFLANIFLFLILRPTKKKKKTHSLTL